MSMKRVGLAVLMLLVGVMGAAGAQDTAHETGWPVEEQVLGEPTSQPVGWMWEGTILYQGEYGIHGLRDEWETSRVMAFTNVGAAGNSVRIYQGALSLDQKWYIAPEADSFCDSSSCTSTNTYVYRLHLFDVSGERPRFHQSIDWSLHYNLHYSRSDDSKIRWLDNEHILYPYEPASDFSSSPKPYRLNVFSGALGEWDKATFLCRRCSPDVTRDLVYRDWESFFQLNDIVANEPIVVFNAGIHQPIPIWAEIWSPDSQYYLAFQKVDERFSDLVLRDRDGRLIAAITRLQSSTLFYPGDFFLTEWSPDSRYFWLRYANRSEENYHGLDVIEEIIDIQQQKRIRLVGRGDTGGIAKWSPESDKLLFDSGQILDLETWALYDVDVREDSIIEWVGN